MHALSKILIAVALVFGFSSSALAQSICPSIVTGAVLTAGQWNACFAAKQNTLNFVPLNAAGGVMTGPLITAPSLVSTAGFNITPGTAPLAPNNGDIWATASGLFVQIGGVTSNVLLSANNLSDLASAATARTNLGLGTFATANAATPPAIGGTTPAPGSFSSITDTGILGSTQCLQVNSAGVVSGTSGVCGGSGSNPLLTGTILAKTTTYPAVTGDCGDTITLGGSAQYTLTFNAASGYASNCGFLITNLASETRTKTLAINGLTSCFLYPGQTVLVMNESNTWVIRGDGNASGTSCAGRWRVSATTNFYVRPDGSDTNDGLANSSGAAYLTANAAFNAIAANLDINNQTVTVNHTCGTPPCTITAAAQLLRLVNVSFVGGAPGYSGDCATPTNVKLNPSSSVSADILIDLAGGGQPAINICGFELAGGTNVSFGLYCSGTCNVELNSLMQCDAMSQAFSAGYPSGVCYGVGNGAHLILEGNQTIAGNVGAALLTFNGAMIEAGTATTWTLSGTPAWGNAFIYAIWNGSAQVPSMTFSGASTGTRFQIQWGGMVATGLGTCAVTSTYFPGNANGVISDTTGNRGNCF